MKSLRKLPLLALGIVALLMAGNTAKAQDVDFTPDGMSATAYSVVPIGGTITFSGTLTDLAGPSVDVYINGDDFSSASMPSASLYEDDSSFGANAPYGFGPDFMGATSSGDFVLFTVTVLSGTGLSGGANGPYYATNFNILGGEDSSADQNVIGTFTFDIDVVPSVPEGGATSIYLLLAGAVCFGVMALRTRKVKKAGVSA